MYRYSAILAFMGLTACASAASQISPQQLRISAQDAGREARTVAVSWAKEASLRYLEGEGVTPEGYILPGRGAWRFIYDAPSRADQLVVTVTPKALEQATRPRQAPPGFAVGEAALPGSWIDSPAVLAAVRSAGGEALLSAKAPAISLLLVPLRPAQWVVRIAAGSESREWRVDAGTGAVIR
jgi:hypothetical protein